MLGLILGIARPGLAACIALGVAPFCLIAEQSSGGISEFFEGRTVLVKLDMPGTHQGVDLYPQRPQPIDLKNYSNRLKQFGVSIRNGDSVVVTRVKVKDDNIEFQLGGGGYGTSGDDTDTTAHFTPMEKSGHEKDLEDHIKSESNQDKRRAMQRELDEMRSYRERRDRHEREIAEQAAAAKQQIVLGKRMQGGSRFNLRVDTRKSGDVVTPQWIMASLSNYLTFPPEGFGGSPSARAPEPVRNMAAPPTGDPALSLRKGLTREQVENLYGQPSEVHESNSNGLAMVTCTYRSRDNSVKADFVNGVLVQYTVSSR